jgi:hypothetical protein
MTVTPDTRADARVLEPIGRCVACGSSAGAYWGSCLVCGCPTPAWQRAMADVRALALGASGNGKPTRMPKAR